MLATISYRAPHHLLCIKYSGPLVIQISRWSGQFWAKCSLVFPVEIIITVYCCCFCFCCYTV